MPISERGGVPGAADKEGPGAEVAPRPPGQLLSLRATAPQGSWGLSCSKGRAGGAAGQAKVPKEPLVNSLGS